MFATNEQHIYRSIKNEFYFSCPDIVNLTECIVQFFRRLQFLKFSFRKSEFQNYFGVVQQARQGKFHINHPLNPLNFLFSLKGDRN